MAILEEHIIKISHVSDAKGLEKARADARKAAADIEAAFSGAADKGEDAADDLGGGMEDAAKKSSEVWTGALRQIGARMTDFGIQAAQAIAGYVADTFEGVRETDLFAQTLDVATGELLALEKGFARMRIPADNTREAVKTLRENLGELDRLGTGPAKDSLGSLGLTLDDLRDKAPTEQLEILADALQGVDSASKRTSIAIELMGEDGQRIMPAMLDGAAGVRELTDAARDAGQVLDEETIQKTRELDEALLSMKGEAEGVALSIMTKAMPALTDAAEGMGDWYDENEELIDQNLPKVIDAIATAVQVLASAFVWAAEKSAALGDSMFSFAQWASENKEWVALFAAGVPGGQLLIPSILGNDTGGGVEGPNADMTLEEANAIRAANAKGARERKRLEDGRPTAYQEQQQAAFEADRARQESERKALERRDESRKFEENEKNKKNKKGKKKKSGPSDEAKALAEELRDEFAKLGGNFGLTDKGLEAAIADAASEFDRGGNVAAARKRGIGTIGRLTDTKNIDKQVSQDPLSKLFGIEELPDVSPGDISQDRAPQVLTATINNTFTIDMDFAIDGATRPDLIPDQVLDSFRSMFANEVERQSNYVKVPFSR